MGLKKVELEKKLKLFKWQIQKKFNIKQMILFGSQARGDSRKGSDVDLILVSPKFKGKNFEGASELFKEWHIRLHMGLPVDFLCYTPAQFNKLKLKISIVSQALKEGIKI